MYISVDFIQISWKVIHGEHDKQQVVINWERNTSPDKWETTV